MTCFRRTALLQLWLLVASILRADSAWRYQDADPQEGFQTLHDAPDFRGQNWNVSTSKDLLTVLVPVVPDHRELGYVRNQLRTFNNLFELSSVRRWLVVTPHDHVKNLQRFFNYEISKDMPGIQQGLFEVVEDGQCASELLPHTHYGDSSTWPGWTRQQVVKLACANLIHTPFYLVMDADVFIARQAHVLDLFVTASCNAQASRVCAHHSNRGYRAKNDCYPMQSAVEDWHMRWWRNSAETLQLNVTFNWEYAIGVTPQILSTDISLQLGQYIESRFDVDSWVAFLLDVFAAKNKRNWQANHDLTMHDPAWTEYSLYFLFAQHAQVFEQYHVNAPVLQWNAIWTWEQYEQWDPCTDTFASDTGYLSLVQSNLKVPAETVWQKMQNCWQHE